MTISEIKEKQSLPENSPDRIFAVGKYQLIPDTFNQMVEALNFQPEDKFNAEKQEYAGEWLIFEKRNGLKSYLAKGSKGSEIQLQKAITDLGLEFASFPLYHMSFVNNNQKEPVYQDPIGYNSKQAAYGGSASNPSQSKFCAQDSAKALIETWKNLNKGKKPEFEYETIDKTTNQSNVS